MVRDNDLKYLRAMLLNPDPVITAPELADDVGVTQQAAHKKLKGMKDRGLVNSKPAGSSAVVWWVSENGKAAYYESRET